MQLEFNNNKKWPGKPPGPKTILRHKMAQVYHYSARGLSDWDWTQYRNFKFGMAFLVHQKIKVQTNFVNFRVSEAHGNAGN